MDSSANYASLLEKGIRKKKKKLARGELGWYDPDQARQAEDRSAGEVMRSRMKAMKKWKAK